jgi:hypothetical protein
MQELQALMFPRVQSRLIEQRKEQRQNDTPRQMLLVGMLRVEAECPRYAYCRSIAER